MTLVEQYGPSMTLAEAATVLRSTPMALAHRIRRGTFPGRVYKMGGVYRVVTASLQPLFEEAA